MTLGWQVQPAFAVVQGESSRDVSKRLVSVLRLRQGLRQPPPRQPSRGSVPLLRVPFRRSAGRDRSVLRGEPTANGEARQLRQVRRDHRARWSAAGTSRCQVSSRSRRSSQTMNHRKPSEALRILRDHTPTLFPVSEKKMRWPGPCGDVGRLTNVSPPIRIRHLIGLQVTDQAKFLVG